MFWRIIVPLSSGLRGTHYDPSKCQEPFIQWHSTTSHKTLIFSNNTVITWNLAEQTLLQSLCVQLMLVFQSHECHSQACVLHSQEVPGSSLSLFLQLSSVPPGKSQDHISTLAMMISFHILFNSLFTDHPTIWQSVVGLLTLLLKKKNCKSRARNTISHSFYLTVILVTSCKFLDLNLDIIYDKNLNFRHP
jgi:hypothetical protein